MEKINVAELLRNCPKGMELDCTICNNRVTLEGVVGNGSTYPIRVISKDGFHHMLTCNGGVYDSEDSKCVIFPKGKTSWEGFHRPYINGDIVYTIGDSIAILGDRIGEHSVSFRSYCGLFSYEFDTDVVVSPERFATEEEKATLFKAIKDNGYRWDAETKTLEKIGYQYPKTYEECCDVLGRTLPINDDVEGYKWKLIMNFQRLFVFRDAYWKIGGEQMGLGKPWEPSKNDNVYCIFRFKGEIVKDNFVFGDSLMLEFPTEEMRDAFYENFKELIETVKELL